MSDDDDKCAVKRQKNKEEAAKLVGDILGGLASFKEAIDAFEQEDLEFERLIAEAEKLPPRPVTSQDELFKKLTKKDAKK